MRLIPMAVCLPMLAACAPAAPVAETPSPPAEPRMECATKGLEGLIGQTATQQLGAEALRISGARIVRWIPEGAIITMDYSYVRLNIHLDKRNAVVRFGCG